MKIPDRFRPGPLLTRQLDELRDAFARLGKLDVRPPLTAERSDSGVAVDLPRPGGGWAILSGPTSPYTFSWVHHQGGTSWAASPGDTTGQVAHHVNAVAGLGGSRAWLRPGGTPGEWTFGRVRLGVPYVLPGLPCGPCNIPEQDLFLSWTYSRNSLGGTATVAVTLHYTAGTPPTWISGTVATGGFGNPNPPFIGQSACGPETSQSTHYFEIKCGASQVALFHNTFCAPISDWRAFQYGMIDSTYSCSPFSADWSAAQLTGGDQRMVLTT